MEKEYPSNSLTPGKASPEAAKDEKKVEAIEGLVVRRRKKPLGKRFMDTFVAGEAKGVGAHIMMNVLLPALKDMVVDAATQGIERAIFGENAPSRSRAISRLGQQAFTNYGRFASGAGTVRREDPRREVAKQAPRNIDRPRFDQIIFASKVEGEEIISRLNDMIIRYETASIADLYSIINEPSNFVDDKWGWIDLTGASCVRISHGEYLLNLPQPVSLD